MSKFISVSKPLSRQAAHRHDTLVLSIRPTYVERILSGLKTVELRRRFPKPAARSTALIYSTSPTQAIVGRAIIEAVSQLSLRTLWRRFAPAAAVTREEFDNYFAGVEFGCALHLTDVYAFEAPIHLTDLTRRFEFSPPQSYCYWKEAVPTAANVRFKTITRR
jgi:predicted transcriptional regulator